MEAHIKVQVTDVEAASFTPQMLQRVELLLQRYFAGKASGGNSGSAGSNFGRMIDRLCTYALVRMSCMEPGCKCGIDENGRDCKRCKGTGVQEFTQGKMPERDLCNARCTRCDASGRVPVIENGVPVKLKRKERRRVFELLTTLRKRVDYRTIWQIYSGLRSTNRAYRLVTDAARELSLPAPPPINLDAIRYDRCEACKGTGYWTPIDAVPSPAPRHESSYQMRDDDIEFQGVVSRVMRQLQSLDTNAATVLELHYGATGNRWAALEVGRLFSLWPVTAPGSKLLEIARRSGNDETKLRPPHELMFEEYTLEKTAPSDLRRLLLRQASDASRTLIKHTLQQLAAADTDRKLQELATQGKGGMS